MDLNVEVGKRIKALRKQKGLTQDQVAEFIGQGRVSICNTELGRQAATPKTIFLFCRLFSCEPNDLFPPIKGAKLKYIMVEKTIKVPKKIKIKKVLLP